MLYSARPEHGCIQIGKTLASRTTFPMLSIGTAPAAAAER